MHRLASPRAMRTSTMFDLASVTKVMATTFAVMMLVDRGQIELDAPVYRYLPDFRGVHLDSITVRHLLQHSAGLVQWQPLYYHASNSAQTYDVIRDMPLQWGVGEGRHYSDLGFMLLGYIVERVSGQRARRLSRAESLSSPRVSRRRRSTPSRTGSPNSPQPNRGTSTRSTWCTIRRSDICTRAIRRRGMAGASMC